MKFTIETTCIVPISRRHVYEAKTFEQALLMAVADNDWEDAKEDYAAMMIILRGTLANSRKRRYLVAQAGPREDPQHTRLGRCRTTL
jgi:hypothetical protein